MTQKSAVTKFYKDLEKYGLFKDSQFILNIPLVLLTELFEEAIEMEKIDKLFHEANDEFFQKVIKNNNQNP